MTKRTTKADRQDKARRDKAAKKAGKELRAHFKKLLADIVHGTVLHKPSSQPCDERLCPHLTASGDRSNDR